MATFYEMAIGGSAMVLIGVLTGEPAQLHLGEVEPKGWIALAYLVVFGSLLAYSAYSYLLANAPISLVGTYAYVNPVVAVFLRLAHPERADHHQDPDRRSGGRAGRRAGGQRRAPPNGLTSKGP